jgi:hypothetical protein
MNPKQLKARFPCMFEGENIGFSFARGWQPVFEKLCEDVDALLGEDKRGFHWTQVKEKFGYARFYWSMKGQALRLHLSVDTAAGVDEFAPRPVDGLTSQIDALVREATATTQSRCIVCGHAGAPDIYASYVLVLCEHHAKQHRLGQLDPPWFHDEEVL